MNEYTIEIKEILSELVKVEADSFEEALSKIEEKYYSGKIVLDYSSFDCVDFLEISDLEYHKEIHNLNDYEKNEIALGIVVAAKPFRSVA
ncbi:MAG: DpnD/PcfM family protein [Treponema succinifaciens]|nr:MAG: DpnD/PcfM family protein [Treponema succinifaciens]